MRNRFFLLSLWFRLIMTEKYVPTLRRLRYWLLIYLTETTLAGIFLVCLIRSSPHHLKLATLLGGIARSLAHLLSVLIALEPEPDVDNQALDSMGHYHGQIKGDKEENESDERPGAHVLRLWAVDKPREYGQEVAAEDDDCVIDQLKVVGSS